VKRLVVMRASHVSPDTRVERAAAVLSGIDLDVEVLAWDRAGDLPTTERQATFSVFRYGRTAEHGRGLPNLLGLVLFQWFLVRQTLRRRRGLVAIHACDLSTGLTGLVLARVLRVPLVYDVFDYYADSFPVPRRALPLVRRIETFVLQRADEVILPAATRVAQIAPATPRSLTIVENSPDLDILPTDRLDPTDLGYVGILAGNRLLLEIVRAVADDPTVSLRIAGFGPLETEIAAIAARSPHIDYLGKVDAERALRVLASSTIMFATYDPEVPNHRYSAPNKLAEALALGKPLIVCSGTSIDRQVEEAGVGRVIEYDVDEFMAAAHSLLADRALLARCATEGPSLYRSEHSWPVNAQRLRDVYRRVLPGGAVS
jgi:glycosyltransferase involved in cell wall biosynthesis